MKKTKKNPAKKVIKNINKSKTLKSLVKSFGNETGVRPLGSRVLIKPYTKEELEPKNSFGLILPNSDSKEKSDQGVVVAVGPGEYREGKLVAIGVKVGDKVAFSKYGYEDIKVDGQDFFLIKEENILAIIQ